MKSFLRTKLDALLTHLSVSEGSFARWSMHVSRVFFPEFTRVVEFRGGRLSSDAPDTGRFSASTAIAEKSDEMLCVLNGGFDRVFAVPARVGTLNAYNASVLYVLHSAQSFDANGYGVRSCHAIAAMRDAGVNVHAITRLGYPWDLLRHEGLPRDRASRHGGVEFLHTYDEQRLISGCESDYVGAYSQLIKAQIRRTGATIVLSNSNYLNGIAAAIAARAMNRLCVYEMRGLWYLSRSATQPGYADSEHARYCEVMELSAAKLSDRVVAISESLRQWLVARGIEPEKISVVGNAATDFVNPETLGRWRDSGVFRIGYVGSITKYEGLDVLLRAFALLRSRGFAGELVIAGSGPALMGLRALATKLKVADRTRFLGSLDRRSVGQLYRTLDVCPLPRIRTPVTELVPPLKPLEIMANGVCLAVSNLAPLTELVQHEVNGLVFQADDEHSLAATIQELAHDTAKRLKLVDQAYEYVKANRSWAANGYAYERIFREAIGQTKG